MQDLRGKKVFVGLSGGVDSAVSAALLKEQGADVAGVFIKGWYPPGLPCTWAQDRQDAMRVAAKLRIPFHTLDASVEYKQAVIDYLIREYGAGRTPNPDIMCNREVKFGAFYRFAIEKGADFIATGHYAQVLDGELHRGTDPAKDQSYFLWAVPKDVLPQVVFPLGAMQKRDVRMLAKNYDLPVADKKDSQGICFLGPVSIEEFLSHELTLAPGIAHTEDGAPVGTHRGAVAYTLGERAAIEGNAPGPWYVLGKDMEKNELIVGHELKQKESGGITLSDANMFAETSGEIEAQYRYHGPIISGTFADKVFHPQKLLETLSSGQSLVLYRGTRVIGGGIIV